MPNKVTNRGCRSSPVALPERAAVSRSASVPVAGGAIVAAAATLAYATLAPLSQIFGPTLIAPARPREFALTFDDGPNPTATSQLLDLLARHHTKATFFLIGRYALQQKALARRILVEGHAVGNHTMSHPRLPLCSHRRILREIEQAQHALEDTLGIAVRLFRPPHGFRTPFVLRTARDLGLTTTTWNIIANDWSLPTAEAITARVLAGIRGNQRRGVASNIVLHDGSQTSATADRARSVAAASAILGAHPQARFVTLESWL